MIYSKTLLYLLHVVLFAMLQIPAAQNIEATQEKTAVKVFKFEIKDEIGPPTWRITKLAIDEAHRQKADYILLILNTYGGLVDAADSIRIKILDSKIPVIVFIENNAASAGALISLACDSIYIKPGSTIGAATVVNQTGEAVPDKYQSYMRKKMRATAEINHRNPDIAEAMVDPDKEVEGISEKGKVLTLTASEALEYGFAEGITENYEEALKAAKIEEFTLISYQPSFTDKIINWLISPIISGLLIMLIVGGIYFELQTPGLGFPILLALVGVVLYFAPLYLEGLAENWEILMFLAGIVLLAVEIFVIPGFGIFGILGVFAIVLGLSFSMVGNKGFDFTGIDISTIIQNIFLVMVASSLSVGGAILLGAKLLTSHAFSKLVLNTVQNKSEGYISSGNRLNNEYIGQTALAATVLRPSGKIEINNELLEATAAEGFIEANESVKILKHQNGHFIVRKINL